MTATASQADDSSTYERALRRVLELADYERTVGAAPPKEKYDLARMNELTERLGQPQGCAPVLHVAGTKGKGSVAAMAASILRAAGLRVGLYTSPHLHSFRERIRLDGEPVSEPAFAAAVDRIWPHVEAMGDGPLGRPSTFEALTAMAFDLFRHEHVDVQVIEVGLGGRLDATNVVASRVAAITSLSLDHTMILGDTIEQIAAEKAGIIKPGALRAVTAPQQPGAAAVIAQAAGAAGVPLSVIGRDVDYNAVNHDLSGQQVLIRGDGYAHDVRVALLGEHQAENAAVAVAAVRAMGSDVPGAAIAQGLATVAWEGRFQVLSRDPLVIADGAHNLHSIMRLRATIEEYAPGLPVNLVFGCSRDKQAEEMIAALAPVVSRGGYLFACRSRHPRAAEPSWLIDAFASHGVDGQIVESVAAGMGLAAARAADGGIVLATGSLFVTAEAIQVWQGIAGEHYPEFDPQGARSLV